MKRMILLGLIVLLGVLPGATALIGKGSSLEAELLYYTPVPAQPGDSVEVWIQISNDGGQATMPGTVTILETTPFIIEGENERVKEFKSIPAQQSFLVKTRVRIDKTANEGENYLTIRVQENGANNWLEKDLPITIEGRSGTVSITSAESDPARIAPGGVSTLSIDLLNVGETNLRNIKASLDLTDLSIAPIGSSDSKTISSLGGGQRATFTFDLTAFPGAAANVYQLPVTITYEDEQGNEKSQSETVGIMVGSAPDLLVYFERNDVSKETMEGGVVIKFVNKGLSEIKLLEMEIVESDDIEVTSESPILYVGNIDADDYESADVTLKITKDAIDIPVKVAYKDALNQEYEETYMLHLDTKNVNGGKSSSLGLWLVLLVVVVGGFFLWRRRSSKRKDRK